MQGIYFISLATLYAALPNIAECGVQAETQAIGPTEGIEGMTKNESSAGSMFNEVSPRRNEPPGVEIETKIDLARFMPFRFHRLSVQMAFEGLGTKYISEKLGNADASLTVRDWRLMMLLANFGPLTNAEIVVFANMNAATISRALAHLATEKMVVSKAAPDDGRKVFYSLTKKGAETYNATAPERIAKSDEIEAALSEDERRDLYRILDKLEDRIIELRDRESSVDIEWG